MIEANRLIAPVNHSFKDEEVIDRAIRPKKLADYQGQDHVRDQDGNIHHGGTTASRGIGSLTDFWSPRSLVKQR